MEAERTAFRAHVASLQQEIKARAPPPLASPCLRTLSRASADTAAPHTPLMLRALLPPGLVLVFFQVCNLRVRGIYLQLDR